MEKQRNIKYQMGQKITRLLALVLDLSKCSICGSIKNIQKHHRDYTKGEVVIACASCHRKIHHGHKLLD